MNEQPVDPLPSREMIRALTSSLKAKQPARDDKASKAARRKQQRASRRKNR